MAVMTLLPSRDLCYCLQPGMESAWRLARCLQTNRHLSWSSGTSTSGSLCPRSKRIGPVIREPCFNSQLGWLWCVEQVSVPLSPQTLLSNYCPPPWLFKWVFKHRGHILLCWYVCEDVRWQTKSLEGPWLDLAWSLWLVGSTVIAFTMVLKQPL